MARPKKENIDYFQHDVHGGKTLFTIENRFGNDGYAFWFKLLEMLGDQEGLCLYCDDYNAWSYLVAKTRTSEEKATEILDLLAKLEAIDPDLWRFGKVIWVQKYVDRLANLYGRRAADIPKKPEFPMRKHEQNGVSDAETLEKPGVSDAETPHSIVEHSTAENSIAEHSTAEHKGQGQVRTRKSDDSRDGETEENACEPNDAKESLTVEKARGRQESRSKTSRLSEKQNKLFAAFWTAYPRKKNKGQAEKAWKNLKADEAFLNMLVASLDRAKKSADWTKDGGRYVPYPATWLGARGWEDELETGGNNPFMDRWRNFPDDE